MMEPLLRFEPPALEGFCRDVFVACGLGGEAATRSAEVTVAADARGIPSHGIGRLWRYVNGLKTGLMLVDAKPEIVADTPSSLVVDSHGGMGFPVSVQAMKRIVEKAASNGSAFGCVRDSNHFGIAGYYVMMALEHDMIGGSSSCCPLRVCPLRASSCCWPLRGFWPLWPLRAGLFVASPAQVLPLRGFAGASR